MTAFNKKTFMVFFTLNITLFDNYLDNMNNKLFLFALFGLIPVTSIAEYRMNINFSDPSSISFGTNTSEPGEGTPEEPCCL